MPTNTHANNKYDVTIHSVNTVAGNPGNGLHVAELHITPKNSLDPVFAGDFKVGGHPTVYFRYVDQNGNTVVPPYGPRTSSYTHPGYVYLPSSTDSFEYYFVDYATMQAPVQFPYWPNVAQVQMVEVYEDDNGNLINNEPIGDANYTDPTAINQWLYTWVSARTRVEDRGTVSLNINPVFIRVFVFLHNLPDPLVQDVTEYIDLDLVPQAISVYGCTDPLAVNYSASATIDDGSCTYLGCTNDNSGFWPDINGNDVDGNLCTGTTVFTTQPTGYNIINYPCTDSTTGLANGYETVNFNPQAGADDGSCLIPVTGCGDDDYVEYDPNADFVDNTTNCITLIVYGCIDDSYGSSDINPDINDNCVDGSSAGGSPCAPGNGYFAYNYDPAANVNQVSLTDTSDPCGYCSYYGCTDDTAFNYDASADCDDGSCVPTVTGCYDPPGVDGFGNPLSSNYNYLGTTGAINHDPTVNNVNLNDCYYFPGCTDSADLTYYTQTYIDANGITQFMFDTCVGGSVVDFDDGSCSTTTNFIAGCTDATAQNYLTAAVVDDCSCTYANPVGGCMDATAGDNPDINGDCTSVDINGDIINVGYPNPYGCGTGDGYLSANYDPAANTTSITDPGTGVTTTYTCDYYGCTDANGDNYDANATLDDGSCVVYGNYYLHMSSNNSMSAPHTMLNNGTNTNPTPDVHIIATTMGNTLTGNGPSNGFIYNGVVDFANYDGFTYEDQNGNVLESTAFLFTMTDWTQFPLIFSTRPNYGNQIIDFMPLNQYLEAEAVLVVMGEIDIATLDPNFDSTAWFLSTHPSITFSGVDSDPLSPYFGTFVFSHGDVVDLALEGDPAHDPATDGPGYQFEIIEEYTGVERAEIISLLANQRQQSVWGGTQLDEYLSASNLSTTTGQIGYATYIKCKFYARNVSFDYATGGVAPNLLAVNFIRPFQFVYKPGCMDVTDCDYWADATVDDPTLCGGTYYGCTDPFADNYDSLAGCDDGSCTYTIACVSGQGASNLGPGTYQSQSHGTLGYGLVGNVTPFSGPSPPNPPATNPTKPDLQEFDASLVGIHVACNGSYDNTSFLSYDNHRVFHAGFTQLMVLGQLGNANNGTGYTPLLSPDTAFWTLFTAGTYSYLANGITYTGDCATQTQQNFWTRDHLSVGPNYRRWGASRTRLYLKGMHDTYIESGLHGGTSGSNADITSVIAAPPGTANGIPYGIHGMYLRLDSLDVNDTYTFLIKYRYIPKWQENYTNSDYVTFDKQSNNLRGHIRLGWGYYGIYGSNSASDSNGNGRFIDYNGTSSGFTQTPPPSITNWGGVAGNGPYHSLIEGRLEQRKAYYSNGQANITMYTEQINFVPQNTNNNVIMISIGNGVRLDIESIQVYCA